MPNKPRKTTGSALLSQRPRPAVLPPFPDTPPPLPSGASEGFPDTPEGASDAAPITEALAPSGGVAVDPVTGEQGQDLGTTIGGRDPVLQAELEEAEKRLEAERAAQDARVAAGELHAPVEVSPGRPVGETPLQEHKDKQAAYREHMRAMAGMPPVLEQALAEPDADLAVESRSERAQRERDEAFDAYQERVDAMDKNEPRYVATGRAPRPKVCGYVLAPGDVVPGAANFARLDSWISGGIIRRL